ASSACAGAAAMAASVRAAKAPQPVFFIAVRVLSLWRGHPGRMAPEQGRDTENGKPKVARPRTGRPPGTPPATADDEPGGRSPGSRVIGLVPSSRDAGPLRNLGSQ